MMPGLMGMPPPLASSLSSSVPLTTRAPLAARESTATPPNHIYETVSCSTSSAMPDLNEIANISNNSAILNAETNSIANSSSLTDIFQTTAAPTGDASKLEIKSGMLENILIFVFYIISPHLYTSFNFLGLRIFCVTTTIHVLTPFHPYKVLHVIFGS